jgi:hypothetical protein
MTVFCPGCGRKVLDMRVRFTETTLVTYVAVADGEGRYRLDDLAEPKERETLKGQDFYEASCGDCGAALPDEAFDNVDLRSQVESWRPPAAEGASIP